MAKFFGNLNAVLGVALIALIALVFWSGNAQNMTGVWVFLHVISGVMWIGHLYYFNFTQIPTMPKIPAELKPGVSKFIAPQALFWFRYGALATVVTGLIVLVLKDYAKEALSLQEGFRAIGVGMWLALIMAFNVWFIIWPNQKKALGIVVVEAAEKAKAARMAMLTSRFNTMLSIAMLYCMVAQQNGGL